MDDGKLKRCFIIHKRADFYKMFWLARSNKGIPGRRSEQQKQRSDVWRSKCKLHVLSVKIIVSQVSSDIDCNHTIGSRKCAAGSLDQSKLSPQAGSWSIYGGVTVLQPGACALLTWSRCPHNLLPELLRLPHRCQTQKIKHCDIIP